jgi:hypothetical protein
MAGGEIHLRHPWVIDRRPYQLGQSYGFCQGIALGDSYSDKDGRTLGADELCRGFREGGRMLSRFQNGRVQRYLRLIGIALVVLVLMLIWGCA